MNGPTVANRDEKAQLPDEKAMDTPIVKNGIRYEYMNRSNYLQAALCVSEVFSTNEPLAKFLGVSNEEMYNFTSRYYPLIHRDGLSVVAFDDETGEVVGARVSEDYVQPDPPPDLFDRISQRLVPIFAFLEILGEKFKDSHEPERGQYVHMFMVAVREKFTCRGIAPTMNRIALKRAIEKGYTHAVTEPTGCISQHVLRDKFGFEVLHQIPYDTFELSGVRVFEGLQEHKSGMLMMKELGELGL